MTKIGEGKADLEIGGEKAVEESMNVDEDEIIFPPSEPQLKNSDGIDNAVGPVNDGDGSGGANIHANAVEGGIADPVKPVTNIPVGPPLKQAWNCCACCAVTTAITLIVLTIVGLIVSKYVWDAVSIFSDASDSRNAPFGITVDDDNDIIASTPSYPSVSTPYYPTYSTPNYYTPAYPSYPATSPNYYTPTYPTMPTVYYQPASSTGVYYTPQPTFPTLYYTPYPSEEAAYYTPQPVLYTNRPSTMQPSVGTHLVQDPQRVTDIVTYINSVTLSGRTIAAPPVPIIPAGYSVPFPDYDTLRSEELALQWLIYLDPMQFTPDTPSNQFRLRQRYAILSFLLKSKQYFYGDDECAWAPTLCTPIDFGGQIGVQNTVVTVTYNVGLQGEFPADLCLLSNLTRVAIADMNIEESQWSGSLPSSLGLLTHLEQLSVINVNVTGTIPAVLGELTLLQTLMFEFTHLSGVIPESLGQLTAMGYFSIRSNKLTGTIPESIANWGNVTHVSLDQNLLTGPLPNDLSAWSQLETFIVSTNFLTGTIPQYVGNWTSLQTAHFLWNNFTGAVPDSICALVADVYADCNYIEEVTCNCCVGCI